MRPLLKSIIVGGSLSLSLLAPTIRAENLTALAIDNKFKDADAVITQFNDIRGAVYTFFDDHAAFPASFNVLLDPANLYYAGNVRTPFGTPFTGAISADGRFFNIGVDLRSPEVAKYVAAKINTTPSGNSVVLSVGTPASQALMNNFLSRRFDPTKPQLNEMETHLSMGNNNINNVDTLNSSKINIANLATINDLEVLNATTTLNLTATGVTSLNDLTVETNQLVKGTSTVKGELLVESNAGVAGNFDVTGDAAVTGALAVNGTSSFLDATDFLSTVTIAGDTTITANLNAKDATFENVSVSANTTTDTLTVTNTSTLADVVAYSVDTTTLDTDTLNILQDAAIGRNLKVDGDSEFVGDVTVGGQLSVKGDQHVQGQLTVDRDTTLNENLYVVGGTTFDGGVIANDEFTAALGVYLENADTRLEQGTADALRVTNTAGYIDIGADAAGFIEFRTDKNGYNFDQKVRVEDEIETRSGLNSVKLRASGTVPEMVFSQSGIERAKFALTAPTTLSLSGAKLVATDAIQAPAFKSTKTINNATLISSATDGIYTDYNSTTPFSWSTILHIQDTANSSRGFQLAMEDTGGGLHYRNGNNGGWSGWLTAGALSANQTWTGENKFSKPVHLLAGSYLNHNDTSSYDKIRVWNSSSYTIGMKSYQQYGWLNDYAMTFTMNNDTDRGFLWRDSSDGGADGAMSLTTDGKLMVKNRLGFNNHAGVYLSRNGNYLRNTSPSGYLDFGANTTTSFDFITNRPKFTFNKALEVNGALTAQGLSSSGDISIVKNNPWLTLDSSSSGANGVEQGAGISIGESGKKGSAALHLVYTGDGYGRIGMGTVSSSTGLPSYEAMRLHYQSRDVTFLGDVKVSGTNELRFSTYGGGLNMTDSTWLRTLNGKRFYVNSSASDAIYTAGGVKGLGVGRFDGGLNVDGRTIVSSDGRTIYEDGQKLADKYIVKHGQQDISGNKNFYGTAADGQYYNAPIEIREVNMAGSAQSSAYYAPSLALHWGGRTQTRMALAADGTVHFSTNPQLTAWSDLKAGTLYEDGTKLSDKYLGKNAKAKDTEKLGGIEAHRFARRDADNTFTAINTFNQEVRANGGIKVDNKWVISADGNTLYENGTRLVDKYLGKTATAVNASKIDNIDSWQLARTDIDETFNKDVAINENLTVTGTTTLGGAVTANNGLTVNGNWLRVSSTRGLYFQSYGGGLHMQDTTWIRTYNNKKFYVANTNADAILTAGGIKANGLGRFDGGIQVDGKWIASSTGNTLYEGGTALSSKYLGKTAKAADANLLDGINSTNFARTDVAETFGQGVTMNKTLRVVGNATFDNTVTAKYLNLNRSIDGRNGLDDALTWIQRCEDGLIAVCTDGQSAIGKSGDDYYQTNPDGSIEMWGTFYSTTDSDQTVYFPTSLANTNYKVAFPGYVKTRYTNRVVLNRDNDIDGSKYIDYFIKWIP